eukprot:5752502-Pyramimonas_sp.AAC.1
MPKNVHEKYLEVEHLLRVGATEGGEPAAAPDEGDAGRRAGLHLRPAGEAGPHGAHGGASRRQLAREDHEEPPGGHFGAAAEWQGVLRGRGRRAVRGRGPDRTRADGAGGLRPGRDQRGGHP